MRAIMDNGSTLEVLWMEGPVMTDGSVWVKIKSGAPLHEVARLFETAGRIEREGTEEKPAAVYEGYKLMKVEREKGGTIFVQMAKEDA